MRRFSKYQWAWEIEFDTRRGSAGGGRLRSA